MLMKLQLLYQVGKKSQVKRKERFCKRLGSSLDSDNSNVKRDSPDETDTDKWLDSLTPTGILSLHSCSPTLSFHLFYLSSHSSVCILFHVPHIERIPKNKGFLDSGV